MHTSENTGTQKHLRQRPEVPTQDRSTATTLRRRPLLADALTLPKLSG
ncbi:hypothetical protein A628_04109 [Salmonella enterica subsp. enterica serovar Cubana str. 76814]|uniref:Uncharacterized protein n=1 Tax=Salmonella enterica subsp. enterica serovar Cubana str. 76814 TaxID=1192560 RepID=V7IL26_SALET|nr:hypothetical protein A628_04109 [Salmonella enterica subsp. enterica serovar Cubana str. 76814]